MPALEEIHQAGKDLEEIYCLRTAPLAIRLVNYLIKSDKFRIFAVYTLVLGCIVVILGIAEKVTGNAVQAFITGLIR